NPYIWLALGTTLGFGFIGFVDDYRKLRRRNTAGLICRYKLLCQFIVAISAATALTFVPGFTSTLTIPFFKEIQPDLGLFYIPFAALVMVGASNAVNLTDGLDGLAIGPVMITALTYCFFSYVSGHIKFAEYLQVPHVAGSAELSVFCGALVAAGMGFLWF